MLQAYHFFKEQIAKAPVQHACTIPFQSRTALTSPVIYPKKHLLSRSFLFAFLSSLLIPFPSPILPSISCTGFPVSVAAISVCSEFAVCCADFRRRYSSFVGRGAPPRRRMYASTLLGLVLGWMYEGEREGYLGRGGTG